MSMLVYFVCRTTLWPLGLLLPLLIDEMLAQQYDSFCMVFVHLRYSELFVFEERLAEGFAVVLKD